MMAFSAAQLKNLEAKLDSKHVRTRRAHDTTLAYVEGWHVIAEANRIFGYDAWDRHTLSTRCVWSSDANHRYAAAYTAKVRIAVRAGSLTITREGCGCGEAKAPTPGEAHELALKAAETDATKRALATFGNPFGLALYDRELAGVKNRKTLISAPDGYRGQWLLSLPNGSGQSFSHAHDFVVALEKALAEAADIEQLFAIWERNVDAVRTINKQTNRSTPRGVIAQSLVAHLKKRAIVLANLGNQPSAAGSNDQNGLRPKVDKSVLTIGEPRRIRCKEHLRFVASQPCLICGRSPPHAHHVRFAQSRGLSLKVSDEFTVPLCATHHQQIHTTGKEREWWLDRKVDPLSVARDLWQESRQNKGLRTENAPSQHLAADRRGADSSGTGTTSG
jgi:DNA recombination protein Rad52